MHTGKAIRQLIEERGLSQVEFARLSKMSRHSLNMILRSSTSSVRTLERVAEALEIKPSKILAIAEKLE